MKEIPKWMYNHLTEIYLETFCISNFEICIYNFSIEWRLYCDIFKKNYLLRVLSLSDRIHRSIELAETCL